MLVVSMIALVLFRRVSTAQGLLDAWQQDETHWRDAPGRSSAIDGTAKRSHSGQSIPVANIA
jgi:hypothetical protein